MPDAAASLANLGRRVGRRPVHRPHRGQPDLGPAHRRPGAGQPRLAPRATATAPRVRFANRPADLEGNDQAWTQPRVLYVHHPSDPVGNWRSDSLWRRPEWTEPPKGYDIPARAGWFPIVTGVQEVADLIAGFSAPSGYGHNYADRLRAPAGRPWCHRRGGRRPTAPGCSSNSRPSEAGAAALRRAWHERPGSGTGLTGHPT